MQPLHATSDMYMADLYWGKRAEYSYNWRLQLYGRGNGGIALRRGRSNSPNPFLGIHAGGDAAAGADGSRRTSMAGALRRTGRLTAVGPGRAACTPTRWAPPLPAGMEHKLGRLLPRLTLADYARC